MVFHEKKGIVHGNLKAENIFVCGLHQPKIVHPKLIQLMKTSENDNHAQGKTLT